MSPFEIFDKADSWDTFNEAFDASFQQVNKEKGASMEVESGLSYSQLDQLLLSAEQKLSSSHSSSTDLRTGSSLCSMSPAPSPDYSLEEPQKTQKYVEDFFTGFEPLPPSMDALSPVNENAEFDDLDLFRAPPMAARVSEDLRKSPNLFKFPLASYDNVQQRHRSVSMPATPRASVLSRGNLISKKGQSCASASKKVHPKLNSSHNSPSKCQKLTCRRRSNSNPLESNFGQGTLGVSDAIGSNLYLLREQQGVSSSANLPQSNPSPTNVMALLNQMQLGQQARGQSLSGGAVWNKSPSDLLAAAQSLQRWPQGSQPTFRHEPVVRKRGYSDPLKALAAVGLGANRDEFSSVAQGTIRYPMQSNFSHPTVSVTIAELRVKLDEELLNVDFEDITVSELKDHLRRRNLASKGKKQPLLEKLLSERERAHYRMRQRLCGVTEEALIAQEAREAASSTVVLTHEQARRLSCSSQSSDCISATMTSATERSTKLSPTTSSEQQVSPPRNEDYATSPLLQVESTVKVEQPQSPKPSSDPFADLSSFVPARVEQDDFDLFNF